ncbi:MAG: 16S rRNA (adenine(1518)-N(6)/adenine(1519)-N(6))-dimethyltransferase RsmA [Aquiluna sp.]|nr:16S rRNA (adenine(1518)-N(6)/adenine(1519)-N(6))-dimethyltransferase RsmA [Aquiluna sp.]
MLGANEIRQLASKLNIKPTKKLGQNFVIDPNTINRIVTAAGITASDRVVEIGPGLGSLTLGILSVTGSVMAVEIDPVLAAELPETISRHAPGATLQLVQADALRLKELPDQPTALVANLPYNISVPVLLHFLETFPSIEKGLVMVQAEVAHRLAAKPGGKEYGSPSLKMSWYGSARLAGNIGRNVFWPAPNVDSALVYFEHSIERPQDRKTVFAAIDAAFGQRRKTLRQALSTWAGSPAQAEEICRRAGIDPGSRGEQLLIDDFIAIAGAK